MERGVGKIEVAEVFFTCHWRKRKFAAALRLGFSSLSETKVTGWSAENGGNSLVGEGTLSIGAAVPACWALIKQIKDK